MRGMILVAALSVAGCGLKAEHEYDSAKANGATYRKLCSLAQAAADFYDGTDSQKYTEWSIRASNDCAMARLGGQ